MTQLANRSERAGSLLLVMAVLVAVSAGLPLHAATPAVTKAETADGLKVALNQAVTTAVTTLGKPDGFLGNPEVRIPLPGKLEKAAKRLRKLGMSKQTDALELAMNRAAEAAVPEAKALFVDAIKQMSVADAVGLLRGPEDAATQYFRGAMSGKLTERFQPIVSKATQSVQLAKHYNDVAGRASALGLVDEKDANVDAYVTRKTLDGLFLVMAREEAAIRRNPLGQANALLRKVFGKKP
jgi:Protein of unknown function (DUF4197)